VTLDCLQYWSWQAELVAIDRPETLDCLCCRLIEAQMIAGRLCWDLDVLNCFVSDHRFPQSQGDRCCHLGCLVLHRAYWKMSELNYSFRRFLLALEACSLVVLHPHRY
jgi:hypothetical protein